MLRGELYYAFAPGLTAKRSRSHAACHRLNQAANAAGGNVNMPRRERVMLWRDILGLEPPRDDEEEFDDPHVDAPM